MHDLFRVKNRVLGCKITNDQVHMADIIFSNADKSVNERNTSCELWRYSIIGMSHIYLQKCWIKSVIHAFIPVRITHCCVLGPHS